MRDKSPGLFFLLLFFQPGHIAIISGSKANFFFKEHAERSNAFKSHFIANFCYLFIFCQQIPGFIDSFSCEVLMWSGFVDLPE